MDHFDEQSEGYLVRKIPNMKKMAFIEQIEKSDRQVVQLEEEMEKDTLEVRLSQLTEQSFDECIEFLETDNHSNYLDTEHGEGTVHIP